jgi:hypothetical protein
MVVRGFSLGKKRIVHGKALNKNKELTPDETKNSFRNEEIKSSEKNYNKNIFS